MVKPADFVITDTGKPGIVRSRMINGELWIEHPDKTFSFMPEAACTIISENEYLVLAIKQQQL